ncbi:MAG: UvrD-helicase domain-containing protein [Christensenellaceae bacterium]|jgi:ATP-dependent helicase/nuclease subunit A|nr:UvrD-helicase domain-containing protein [Christensenellaceae bacterium]
MTELVKKKIEYTSLQKEVLKSSDKNVLVPASAGSGKTSVVIERVCRQLCEGVDISELLVVTFTEAAALEMLNRLGSKLNEQAESNPNIISQIERLAIADVCTLHAFCKKLIKQYFFALDIDPSFSVCDETQSSLYKAKALDEVLLSEAQEYRTDFEALIEAFDASRRQDGLRKSILNTHEFLCSITNKQKFLKETAYLCYDTNLNKNPAAQIILKDITGKVSHYKQKFESLFDKCKANGFIKTGGLVQTVLNSLPVLTNNFEEALGQLAVFCETPMPRKPALKEDNPEYDAKEEYGEIKEKLTAGLRKIVDDYSDIKELKDKLQRSKETLTNFLALTDKFEKEYCRIKRLNNCLDFCDLEEYTRQILMDPVLRAGIQNKYKFVYVDEYQDINGVQEDILLKVSCGDNLIMVGDIKQSIYGFRNSDPQIFIDKFNSYQSGLVGQLRPLSENFRSNPTILNFVNRVFEKVMTPDTCGIDYNQNRLIPRGEHQKTIGPAVVIDIKSYKQKLQEQTQPKVYDITSDFGAKTQTAAQAEAKIVAGHIKELVSTKTIGYGDIAILCRQRKYLKEFALALKEYKIPLFYSDESDLFSSHEILLMLSFLKLINNPKDDISLTTVLSSGIVDLSFSDLYDIKRAYKNKDAPFFEACKEYSKKGDAISVKINELYEVLEQCRDMLNFCSIFEVLNFINSHYHITDFYLLLPDGVRRSQMISDYITGFSGLRLNIPEYLNYAESLTMPGGGDAAMDCVRIDTMHSSKGLEFNVVFLVGLSSEFVSKSDAMTYDPEMGAGIGWSHAEEHLKDNTLARKGIDTKNKIRETQEEMRLLYVAMTRAKNYLFMSACNVKEIRPMQTAYEIKSAKSHFDFISSAFDENTLEYIKNGGVITQGEGENSFSIIINDEEAKVVPSIKRILFDETDIDKNLKRQIDEYFSAIYKHENAVKIAQKNSVTGLINAMGEGFESINSTPKTLTLSEHKTVDIDHAKLGSAYHLIMQKLEFETASPQSIDKLIADLVGMGQLEEKYVKLIDKNSILLGAKAIVGLGRFNIFKEQQFMAYVSYNQLVENMTITDKVLLQGVIDLILSGEKNIIIDYKTTKAGSEKELCERYKTQMKLYKKAAEGALKQKIDKVYIYSFTLKKLIEVLV